MTESQTRVIQNPLENGPKPPYPSQQQTPPGIEAEMRPRPDYGEQSYQGNQRLLGKAAIITGGDSGIGRAVALAYAREGADVLISYLNEDVDAEETVRVVTEAGRQGVAMAGDIQDPAHCRHLVDRAVAEFGRLDILVNNAAFQMSRSSILDIPDEEIDRIFRTNIMAQFYLVKAALPHLKPGSSIINTASVQAYQPSPTLLPYAATKAAIANFTKGLAQGLSEHGIRVNAVAPGPVWTPLIVMSMPNEAVKQFGESNPLQRAAQPVELAPAYVFLASAESSFVNGEVLGVHGGVPLMT